MWAGVGVASAAGAAAGAAAAAASVSRESRGGPAIVGVAAAVGGLGGFLFWRCVAGQEGREAAALARLATERALGRVDRIHDTRSKDHQDPSCDLAFCSRVEQWVNEMASGQPGCVSTALRLAARSQHLQPQAREGQLQELLASAGLDPSVAGRAASLVAKDATLCRAGDRELALLEDAASLARLEDFLLAASGSRSPSVAGGSACDATMQEELQKLWRPMSRVAQARAAAFEFTPQILACLLQAVAAVERSDPEVNSAPMVAPRLPSSTVRALRESWAHVQKERFGDDFFARLYAEDPSLQAVFASSAARPSNAAKVVQMLLDLLDVEQVPRLEKVVHALAVIGMHFSRLRLAHLAPIKRALVRCVTAFSPSGEKKRTNQVWEAFFYSLCAVMAPALIMDNSLTEVVAATAAALPMPGGGTHAGILAANGSALLEMCLSITTLTQSDQAAPQEVLHKLHEVTGWLLQAVKDEVHAYCGLLCASLAVSLPPAKHGSNRPPEQRSPAEEAECRLWQRRAIEVPINVAEISVGIATTCLPSRRTIKRSLHADWVAGAKLLRTATEISMRNAQINFTASGQRGGREDGLDRRFAKLRDSDPPWEDLIDI